MDVPVTEGRSEVPDWARPSQPKITEPQRGYLLSLIEKKQVKPEQEGKVDLIMECLRISEDPEEFGMSKDKASELITWFKNQPDKSRVQPACPHCNARDGWLAQGIWTCHRCGHSWASDNWPTVPTGRYAVPNPDGSGRLMFYSVDRPTEGRWAGYLFVNVWASDERHPIKNKESKDKILAQIAVNPKAAAEKFGQEIGSCGICGRTLTDETSRAIGIGPVCRAKSEWY